jgi:hypothetical protein
MRTTLLLLVLLAGSALASQTVWKWVDEKGVTHYSDRSVPGATKVELHASGQSGAAAESPANSDSSESPADAGPPYRDFEIWQPANDESFVNTGGAVAVNVRLEPGLQAGHSVFLYLDGRLVEGYPGNALSFELQEMPRGTHTVLAVINDDRGQRVQETPPVRFTVRQESVAQPPVGPGVRPSPKPQRTGAAAKPLTSQPTYAALNGSMAQIDPATNKPVVTKPAVVGTPKGP